MSFEHALSSIFIVVVFSVHSSEVYVQNFSLIVSKQIKLMRNIYSAQNAFVVSTNSVRNIHLFSTYAYKAT
jgi:hypothetical protein